MSRVRSLPRILGSRLHVLWWGIGLLPALAAAGRELRFEIAATHASTAQVYFGHSNFDYTEPNSVSRPFAGDGQFHELSYPVPDWEQLAIRIDPGSEPGTIRLRRLRLINSDGRATALIPSTAIEAFQQVEVRAPPNEPDEITLVVGPGNHDPAVGINEMTLRRLLDVQAHVSKTGFALVGAGLLIGLLLALVSAWRWVAGEKGKLRRYQWAIACGVFGLMAGVRLAELAGKVSWAPYLDQYEGELATLIRPFENGVLRWNEFAAPHNDHRITTTRVIALGTFLANGEWDNRVLVLGSCLVQALGVAWVSLLALRGLRGREAAIFIAFVVGASLLLNDWANIVCGFQIQFQLLLVASLMTMALLPNARPGSAASWAGLAAGVFAAACMGSGFLALEAAVAGMLVRAWIDRRLRLGSLSLIAAALCIGIYAWEKRAIFPALDYLHAKNLAQWFNGLWCYGAWPFPPHWFGLVALWIPWLLLVGRMLWRREGTTFQVFLVSLGIWLILQVVALAYGRAGFAPEMSSRYTGMLEWTSILAVGSLLALSPWGAAAAQRSRRGWNAAALVACAVLGGFLAWRSGTIFLPQYRAFAAQTREHESRLGTFMRDNDPAVFAAVEFPHKPYPITERLVSILRDPAIRDALPAPLQRERYRRSDPVAFRAVSAGPLTQVARAALGAGAWLALAGGLVAGWAVWRMARMRTAPVTEPAIQPRGTDYVDRPLSHHTPSEGPKISASSNPTTFPHE